MKNNIETSNNHFYNNIKTVFLCTEKDNTVVKYSIIDDSNNLFVSKYQMYLPTEEELRVEIERDVLELGLMYDKNIY